MTSSSRQEVLFKKTLLTNLAKFINDKHLLWGSFFIKKVAGLTTQLESYLELFQFHNINKKGCEIIT